MVLASSVRTSLKSYSLRATRYAPWMTFSTGSLENINPLVSHPSFQFTPGSVMDEALASRLMGWCDTVFHLAATVGVKLAMESPVGTIVNNVNGAEVVLKHAAESGKRVLLTSSSEVYGGSPAIPFREDAQLSLGPVTKSRWSYAWSKAMDESLAMAYHHERRLPVVVVRLFNTVGPRQSSRYGMVIPSFVRQALAAEPIAIYGDGTQTRCFSAVGDVVRGLIDLAAHPGATGEVFNVGSDQEVTINSLALMIKELTDSPSELTHVPYDQVYGGGFEDLPRRVPDLTKIRGAIGYEVTEDLEAILRSVIGYERSK